MDNRFIRKHDVVGERLLEGSLRGTDRLRAGIECTRGLVRCSSIFCAREDAIRCCWVRHGRGHGIHGQCMSPVMGRRKDERGSLAIGTLWHNKQLLVFATVRLTVMPPILKFCEEKNTRQSFGSALWHGYHKTRGKTGGVVQTNSTNPLWMNPVGECHSPEKIHYSI